MDEVRRQLGSLERQARKAQQYKALQAERRELALALLAADYAALAAQAEAVTRELESLRETEEQQRARIAHARRPREAASARCLQESEHRLSDLRQSVQKIQGELERLLERREQMGVQIRELVEEARAPRGGDPRARRAADRPRRRARGQGPRLAEAERAHVERTARSRQAGGARSSAAGARSASGATGWRRCGWSRSGSRPSAPTSCAQAGELRERQAQLDRRAERLAVELAAAQAEADALAATRLRSRRARQRAGAAALAARARSAQEIEIARREREAARAEAQEAARRAAR